MWSRIAGALVLLACGAGCTTLPQSPATAPSTIAATTTQVSETATTTSVPTTTTTLDRVAEIEAIFLDLEQRRLQAILDQDEEAYRSVFANEYYEQESMIAFDLVEVIDPNAVSLTVYEILVDRPDCLVALVGKDLSGATTNADISTDERVAETVAGAWGISWVGKGWRCDRPHPLAP